eukprot:6645017-Pyramimonas_sp.AAC.1
MAHRTRIVSRVRCVLAGVQQAGGPFPALGDAVGVPRGGSHDHAAGPPGAGLSLVGVSDAAE